MTFPRSSVSPMPTYTMSGLDAGTATAPTDDDASCPSLTGAQLVPPSVVFHNPPPVAPKKYSLGRVGEPATAIERPPRFGPMLRHVYGAKRTESAGGSE